MSESVEIPFDAVGFEQLLGEVRALGNATRETAKATEGLGKSFKFDLALDQIGKVGDKFSGFTQEALKGVEQIGKAFLAGGPLGAALGIGAVAVQHLAKAWEAEEKAAKAANEAAAKKTADAAEAVKKYRDALAEASRVEEAARISRSQDISFEQALAKVRLNGFAGSADSQRDRIAGLRSDLEQAKRDVLDAEAARKAALNEFGQGMFGNSAENLAEARARKAALEKSVEDETEALRSLYRTQTIEEAKQRAEAAKTGAEDDQARRKEARDKRLADTIASLKEFERAEAEGLARLAAIREESRNEEREQANAEADRAEREAKARDAETAKRRKEKFAEEEAARAADLVAKRAAADAEAEIVSESIQAEIALREQQVNTALGTGEALARMAIEFADGETRKTKAQYEEAAKRAAIEGAIQVGLGIATSVLNPPESVTHFLAAAQFAAIAGGSLAASAGASNAPKAATNAAAPSSASQTARASRTSPRGGTSDGKSNVTFVVPGGLFVTRADVERGVGAALAGNQRRK